MASANELTEVPEIRVHEHDEIEKHPKEIVDEALNDLLNYLGHLETLSKNVAQMVTAEAFFDQLIILIDGIHTLTEIIGITKKTFKLGNFNPIRILETELLVILKNLLRYQEQGQIDQMAELLQNQLPRHFQEWKSTGIPNLIRARDS